MDRYKHVIYVDSRVPRFFRSKSGSRVDVYEFLSRHEFLEKFLEQFYGLIYPRAHRLSNEFEKKGVLRSKIGWDEYSSFFEPFYRICMRSFSFIPPDLDLRPYLDSGESPEFIERMRLAMTKHKNDDLDASKTYRVQKGSSYYMLHIVFIGKDRVTLQDEKTGKKYSTTPKKLDHYLETGAIRVSS